MSVFTDRDATQGHPLLMGNFIDPNVLTAKGFFEMFKEAYMDVDEFTGSIEINLLEKEGRPRGRLKFVGNIKMRGSGKISANVPAGECWIIKDKIIDSQNGYSIQKGEVDELVFTSPE